MDAEVCEVDQVPTIRREILEEATTTIPEGTILGGRYEVGRLIGMGGMGAVYLGTQTNIHRRVAVKTLKKELMSNERLLKRFYREARAAAALDHPNIVKVYDFGLDSELGYPYIAMEFLEGRSLDALIEQQGRFTEERACEILGAVARALTDAHSKGVVHRDLKPDNVHVQSLSDGNEHIKVLDFGIAKIRHPDGTPTEKLTGTGMALGTPYYMSPEQAMGKGADFRSDLYAIGCILYQLVSGELPFDAEQPMAVLLKQLREPAPALPEKLSDGRPPSAAFRNLYSALMAKKPDDRPSSTLAVAEQLTNCVKVAQGKSSGEQTFIFGGKTLGPSKDQVEASAGLETLLRDSIGEKETLSFGAVADPEVEGRDQSALSDEEQEAIAGRRRTPMVVAAAVLLIGGAAAFILSNSGSQVSVEIRETEMSEVRAPVTSATKPKPEKVRAATKPKTVSTYAFNIDSRPTGAQVFIDGKKVGVTPYGGERGTDKPEALVRIEKVGFAVEQRSLNATQKTISVDLAPKADRVQNQKTSQNQKPKEKSGAKTLRPAAPSIKGKAKTKPTPRTKQRKRARPLGSSKRRSPKKVKLDEEIW